MGKKDGAPRGRMSSYAFFVQTCRAEHRKQYPGESVIFAEFTKKCAEKWRVFNINILFFIYECNNNILYEVKIVMYLICVFSSY